MMRRAGGRGSTGPLVPHVPRTLKLHLLGLRLAFERRRVVQNLEHPIQRGGVAADGVARLSRGDGRELVQQQRHALPGAIAVLFHQELGRAEDNDREQDEADELPASIEEQLGRRRCWPVAQRLAS